MDLRSIKPGIAAASQMPLFMVHPKTGEMLTPMGYTKRGAPMWPVMGGAEENEGGDDDKDDDKGEEDDDSDEDEDDESEDDDDDDSGDDKAKGKNAKAKIKALEEEKDRHFKKAKKAKARAEAAEAELAALKAKYEGGEDKSDKDKDKGDKAKPDDAKIRAAEAKAQRLTIENAFLRVNEIPWHRPEQALALMMADDDYEIEFDDDGKVDRKSLRAELKRFAKENPHLVKKAAPKDDEDGDEGDKGQRSTAPKMNGKRKGKKQDDTATREQLAKMFPALNRMS